MRGEDHITDIPSTIAWVGRPVLVDHLCSDVAIGLFLIAFLLVAMVAALPWTAPDKPSMVFLLCLLAGFPLVGRKVWRARHWAFWFIPLAAILLVLTVALSRSFHRIDMLAIVFHRDFGMEGANIAGLETQILQGALCGLGLTLVFLD